MEKSECDQSGVLPLLSSLSETKAGFQVGYEVKECEYGQGLFAKEFISKGTLIWKYVKGVNVNTYYTLEDIQKRLDCLSKDEQDFFMSHVYLFDGCMNEITDDGCYWNHSETPNTGSALFYAPDTCWYSSYAIQDIQPGEQLFDDYGTYEYPEYFIKLAEEYKVPQDFIVKKDFKKPGFHIKYQIKKSKYGLGIFATEFIPQNSLIWRFAKDLNIRLFKTEQDCLNHLNNLPTFEEKYNWMSHVYCCDGYVNEILDDGKMWNHSETPNTYSGYNGDYDSTYAKEDILPGSELFDDYGLYEYPKFYTDLCAQYKVPLDFIKIKS